MTASTILWLYVALTCATSATPATAGATAMPAERVVSRADFGGTVSVRNGDVLVIRPPLDIPEWQVDFATDILELLNPSDRRRSPGAEGWRFRAVAAGETDIALTEIPRRGGGAPPAPRRFVVTIRVTN